MKKIAMMILVLGVVFTSQAQSSNKRPGVENETERMEKAKTHLGLSDSQFEEWKAVHEKYADEMKALRENKTQDREKGKELREKIDGELEAILTEEQKEKFAEVKKQGPQGRKPKGRKPDGGE